MDRHQPRSGSQARLVEQQDPARFEGLMARAQRGIAEHYALYQPMAEPFDHGGEPTAPTPAAPAAPKP